MVVVVVVMMTATVTHRDSSITLFVPELLSLSFSLKVQFASALSELKLSYSLPYPVIQPSGEGLGIIFLGLIKTQVYFL